jgi:hypothetical protein
MKARPASLAPACECMSTRPDPVLLFETSCRLVSQYHQQYHLRINTATKLLQAMRNNPRDWSMDQVLSVAQRYDIEARNNGGSHHVLSHPTLSEALTVPAHRPIKPIYIKRLLQLIDQLTKEPTP